MVRFRRTRALAAITLTTALLGTPLTAVAGPDQRPAASIHFLQGHLPPRVLAAALRGPGSFVRRSGAVTVERVIVPSALRAPGVPTTLWRVTVAGDFPPRALRYVVTADGRPIAYATPTASARQVRAVTADPSVLTATLAARYELSPSAQTGVSPAQPFPSSATGVSGSLPGPAPPGPYAVTTTSYNLGDRAVHLSGMRGRVELAADVHYPTGLPGGPFPLVLFMHGNHYSCYHGNRADYTWPCNAGWKPLPNDAGYDYIAGRLASYGFIVASVSANGVNVLGNQVEDTGMLQRGELLQKHLDLWNTWTSAGGAPFGTLFLGKVDMQNVGLMGHSRGGEGAVYGNIVNQEQGSPYGINAVLALAPVDFTGQTINNVPFSVVLPYCDGDVSDLQGAHFFDASRYNVPDDLAPKSTVTVFGANHDFFNTTWSPSFGYPGAWDDGTNCAGRLRAPAQRRVGRAYVVGFFRRYLAGTTALDQMWTGAAQPQGIGGAKTLVSYLAPDMPGQRLDLNRFTQASSLSVDQLGGSVIANGLAQYGWCADTYEFPCIPGFSSYFDVHLPGLAQATIGGSDGTGSVRFSLPPGAGDLTTYDAFQLRAAVNPGYGLGPGMGGVPVQDFSVVLVDGAGNEASVSSADVGDRPLVYPRGISQGWGHVILNQVRFPLTAFDGVNLADIREVDLRFPNAILSAVDVADAAFTAGAP